LHPTFIPVLSELVQMMLAGGGQMDAAAVGEPMVRMLPSSVTSGDGLQPATIEGEPPINNVYGSWEWTASQGCVLWTWPEPPGPGIFALQASGRTERMVATAAPAMESDLSTLDEETLTNRIGGEREIGFRSSTTREESNDQTWSWLIVGCLLGLIAEIVALRLSRM
jgi:hypothetical protein